MLSRKPPVSPSSSSTFFSAPRGRAGLEGFHGAADAATSCLPVIDRCGRPMRREAPSEGAREGTGEVCRGATRVITQTKTRVKETRLTMTNTTNVNETPTPRQH
eukprot:GHVU01064051.1.p2 GENE.GHVU01064051.1~~GHVU01064051.1.p2  ORF type:complete len:104 (+),score=12.32 GHVU01064051.1:276-587(+)